MKSRPTGVSTPVQHGYPAEIIVAASRDAQLVVLGSHGQGGWTASLLGSVSQQCTHHAHCPVLLMRSDGG